jgi:serine/threonine-protein kinase RsbT
MTVTGSAEDLRIESGDDVVRVRQLVRARAIAAKLSLVDQTKLITAASELARNTLVHGGSGTARIESLEREGKRGVRATFSDAGPGIADVAQAMTDGYTSGSGLGLGLGGARRLVDEFDLTTAVGTGTTVTVVKWTR